MTEFYAPWLELAVLAPLLGAYWVSRYRDADQARYWSVLFAGVSLALTAAAWLDFEAQNWHNIDEAVANFPWHKRVPQLDLNLLALDRLSAPLLPLAALLYFLTILTTLRTKVRRFSFTSTLVSEAILLATFSCTTTHRWGAWAMISLLAAGAVPPYLEILARGRSGRVYLLHMALFVALLFLGESLVDYEGGKRVHTLWAILPLLGAVFIRSGIAPFHCWLTDLFDKAAFGTSLLYVTPIVGAYAAVRLVLPIAPSWVLQSIGVTSLFTAVYAAGMALIQRDARRFFCYLFLSHSALVLVGLEAVTRTSLTGALCVWLSVGLSLGGFGLTLRALEARVGRLSLTEFQGHYEYTPNLAMLFGLTGLASVGFPGTFGFVGTELLVDGAVGTYAHIGVAVIFAAALNGIAVVQAYFRLFTGKQYVSSVSLLIRSRERFAVLALAALILIGGFFPQPNISSRYHAADQIQDEREKLGAEPPRAYDEDRDSHDSAAHGASSPHAAPEEHGSPLKPSDAGE